MSLNEETERGKAEHFSRASPGGSGGMGGDGRRLGGIRLRSIARIPVLGSGVAETGRAPAPTASRWVV